MKDRQELMRRLEDAAVVCEAVAISEPRLKEAAGRVFEQIQLAQLAASVLVLVE